MTDGEFRTDKVHLGYLPTYERLAAIYDARHMNPRILEIGAADGAGMDMFRSVFETESVFGVEINDRPELGRFGHYGEGGYVAIADATARFLPDVMAGPWDLIVDDASHRPADIAATLDNMWPTVRVGGFYVVEDWNWFDGEGVWGILWQRLFGAMIGRASKTVHSGQLAQVATVTVRPGMIIVGKGSAVDHPLPV